jgi:hypothetical protein
MRAAAFRGAPDKVRGEVDPFVRFALFGAAAETSRAKTGPVRRATRAAIASGSRACEKRKPWPSPQPSSFSRRPDLDDRVDHAGPSPWVVQWSHERSVDLDVTDWELLKVGQ